MSGPLVERVGRRTFLKVLGAAAPAAAAACSPVAPERIIPYVVPPEDVIPGVATWYATSCGECPAGCGMRVRTREGRAVKVEGNPLHPLSQGVLCVRGQASLQGLYDPDRIRGPRRREVTNEGAGQSRLAPLGWDRALDELSARLDAARGSGDSSRIAIVTPLLTGSLDRLFDEFAMALGGARRLTYEPFAPDALRAASLACFDRAAVPRYDLAPARMLVSFGADFLETWLSPVDQTRAFTAARRVQDGARARVVHVEPRFSLTASNADEWIAATPGTEQLVALAMTQTIVAEARAQGVPEGDSAVIAAVVAEFSPARVADRTGIPAERLAALGRAFSDPARGPGRSLAIGGGVAVSGSNAHGLQMAIHLLNYVAGNVGRTVQFGPDDAQGRTSPYAAMVELVEAIRAGAVDVLVTYDVNPVFTMPASLDVAEALAQVPFVASLGPVLTDTAARADLVLPTHSPLEVWGDQEPRTGIRGLMQPVMPPLFDSRHPGDLLLDVAGRLSAGAGLSGARDFYGYLRDRWRELYEASIADPADGFPLVADAIDLPLTGATGAADSETPDGDGGPGVAVPDFERFWAACVRRGGVWRETPPEPVTLAAGVAALVFAEAELSGPAGGLIVLPFPSLHFYDGRGANRSWLQEIPDPVTKVAWGSWAEIHPDTARSLGVGEDQVVSVDTAHGALEVPVLLNVHLHPGVVALPIGQGHDDYGRYAAGRGVNPIRLIDATPAAGSGGTRWLSARARVTPREVWRPLVRVQATDDQAGRELARAVTLDDLTAGRVEPSPEHRSLYPEHDHPEHHWGMAIDLDACTGCNACVAACYAENNVPVVGADEVRRGRTRAWLRIERFVEPAGGLAPGGAAADASSIVDARYLPMLCQHCDHAPCESVCPVYATYHTSEGLNAQVYNRCVGTRYCANNCPYKVRRFNWFEPEFPDSLRLQLNPDVTTRSTGVMEKCTFCVQRIAAGKDLAQDEGREIRDGDIVPACAQTCPAQAIVFGDLNDPESRVSRLSGAARGYHVLGELNTRPAVTYLPKVRT